MLKLSNQFKIISICLFIFLGLLFINNNENNKKLYALPGIDLNIRKQQLEEERNRLLISFNNIFDNTNLNHSTRLRMMREVAESMHSTLDDLQRINQEILMRDQYHRQNQNNRNQQNNTRRN
ncbi:MAG: SVM family protein [Candidatus Phytoplasma australasiaticum]|nr:SVM family protein [Candidatus Phytoplasma australasiaticum]MDV3153793.1 SVM family protein [Candidatus Phytoplasma australasiaticum]MDV3167693.1 SVM family protein [Candidatus Phytoplasma australasiaticum]MDV3181048.1 SVM family protein [Candidatus Phytoplasma australasiaticum]MDV3183264.1 SVM family protein [Candidatus Phytoplasma australasiaticum]